MNDKNAQLQKQLDRRYPANGEINLLSGKAAGA